MTKRFLRRILVSAVLALPLTGFAADQLNVLCASDNDWCELMRNTFQKESGIEVSMVRKSAGEIFAQIRAEAAGMRQLFKRLRDGGVVGILPDLQP